MTEETPAPEQPVYRYGINTLNGFQAVIASTREWPEFVRMIRADGYVYTCGQKDGIYIPHDSIGLIFRVIEQVVASDDNRVVPLRPA